MIPSTVPLLLEVFAVCVPDPIPDPSLGAGPVSNHFILWFFGVFWPRLSKHSTVYGPFRKQMGNENRRGGAQKYIRFTLGNGVGTVVGGERYRLGVRLCNTALSDPLILFACAAYRYFL